MKKVINSNEISISELVNRLQLRDNIIVFYRSGNDKNGLPVFLTCDDKHYYFVSPIWHYKITFKSHSILDTLLKASAVRSLCVLEENEYNELFVTSS